MNDAELLLAIGKSIEGLTGEDVVVRDYFIVAEVLTDEGREELRVDSSNERWVDDLSMIEFARQLTLFRMRKAWAESGV